MKSIQKLMNKIINVQKLDLSLNEDELYENK